MSGQAAFRILVKMDKTELNSGRRERLAEFQRMSERLREIRMSQPPATSEEMNAQFERHARSPGTFPDVTPKFQIWLD